jgi:hypothetical protein
VYLVQATLHFFNIGVSCRPSEVHYLMCPLYTYDDKWRHTDAFDNRFCFFAVTLQVHAIYLYTLKSYIPLYPSYSASA